MIKSNISKYLSSLDWYVSCWYLKIALRNIWRQKFYAFINITGLTIGLVTSLLIILYIIDEFSYDKFHDDADRIYRVNLMGRMSGQEFNSVYTSAPVASGFLSEIPGVEQACRIALWEDIPVEHGEDLYTEKTVLVADSNLFSTSIFYVAIWKKFWPDQTV